MRTFDATGVGVEGRGVAALDARSFDDEVERVNGDLAPLVRGIVRDRGPQVRPRQERLVAQHLLEVRDVPAGRPRCSARSRRADGRRDRVATWRRGFASTALRRLVVIELEERLDVTRSRELRGVAESAVGVDASDQFVAEMPANGREIECVAEGCEMVDEAHLAVERRLQLRGLGRRRPRAESSTRRSWREQQSSEADLTVSVDGRVVRARHEGPTVGQEEDRHRPSAVAADELGRRHVERVDVGSLFTVDLDGDEVIVQQRGDRRGPRRTRAP